MAPRRQDGHIPVLENYSFVPYFDEPAPEHATRNDAIKLDFFDALKNVPHLKLMLDIVIENQTGTDLKICEVSAAVGKVFTEAVALVSLHPMMHLQYIATDQTDNLLATIREAAPDDSMKITAWDISRKPPEDMKKCDLIIASNLMHMTSDITSALVNIKSALKPKGFFLLHELSSGLENLKTPFEKNSFISSEEEQKYFPTDGKWVRALETCGLSVVSLKRVGSLSSLLLCRLAEIAHENPLFIDVDESFEFLPQLQAALAQDINSPIWLRSFTTSPTGIIGMTNCLQREIGGERIRCILANPEQKEKVMKGFETLKKLDLVMNVFKDNKYGSYRLVLLLFLNFVTKTLDVFDNISRSFVTII